MCASAADADRDPSCNNEDGAPLVRLVSEIRGKAYYEQVGLATESPACNLPADAEIAGGVTDRAYTRIKSSKILSWIQETTG